MTSLFCFFCPCLSSQAVNNYKKERGHGKSQTQRCSTTPAPSPAPTPPPLTVQPQPQKHQQVRILRLLSGKKTVFFLLVCELSCLFHKLILALFFYSLAKIAAVKHTSIGWKSSFLFLFLCLWHTQGGTSDGAELPGQTSPVCTHRNTMIVPTRLEHTS